MNNGVVLQTNLPGVAPARGKVRDMYDLDDKFLIVTTDRLSAFDVVLPDGIPEKGKVLNKMSVFWFDMMKDIVPNHILETDVRNFPSELKPYAAMLDGRSVLVKKASPLSIECIVRGYVSGSGWKDYQKTGSICGIKLPAGLKESDKLPMPIFTPSTKAEAGTHDENISFEKACQIVGEKTASEVRDIALEVYTIAHSHGLDRGIIIADTKMEFGIFGGEIIIIDEILTPDSSRFWPMDQYKPGGAQPSFDKQFVRDYLLALKWNQKPPAPKLPIDVIRKTSQKYLEAYRRLTK